VWETVLIWLVPGAIALHNLEEALWLPAWSHLRAGRWHRPISEFPFRLAVVILTAAAVVIAVFAQMGGQGRLGFYLLAACALGQGLNVFLPHAAATILTRSYAPGLATGVFFVLPASIAFLTNAFSSPGFDLCRFFIVSAVFIPLVLVSIPVLFRAGRLIERMGES
jgi:hypothetical protein